MKASLLVPLAAAMALTACGGGGEGNSEAAVDPANGSFAAVPQSVAGTKEAESIDCSGLPGAPPQGRTDILGVTIGMPAETARRTLACANPAYQVEYGTAGFSVPRMPDGSRPHGSISVDGGLDDIVVYLMGMPGKEQVIGITRSLEFADGREPTVDQLSGQISGKYGALVRPQSYSQGVTAVYATSGEKLGPENEDLGRCSGAVNYMHGQIANIYGGCGLTINHSVEPKRSNPQLVHKFLLTVVDQQFAMNLIEKVTTEVEAAHAAHRQAEVERANADAQKAGGENRVPTL
jgi:hypothetical protein